MTLRTTDRRAARDLARMLDAEDVLRSRVRELETENALLKLSIRCSQAETSVATNNNDHDFRVGRRCDTGTGPTPIVAGRAEAS